MNFKDEFKQDPIIETENLIIEKLKFKYVNDYLEYYSDKNICKYLDWNGPENREKAAEYFYLWKRGYEENWLLPFAIIDKQSNKMIGSIFFSEFIGKRADLGYELGEKFWSKGFMTEALSAIIPNVIDKLKLQRIQAIVFKGNKASERVLIKLGFKRECILKKYSYHVVKGICIDSYIYSLIP